MATIPRHQEDIKLLIKRSEAFTGQIYFGTNTYRRMSHGKGVVKVPVDNCPVHFDPSLTTPEGFFYAWCSDTENNRKVIKAMVKDGSWIIDRPELIGDWDGIEDNGPIPAGNAGLDGYTSPEETPVGDISEGYTLAGLERLSAKRLRMILAESGREIAPGMNREKMILTILGRD